MRKSIILFLLLFQLVLSNQQFTCSLGTLNPLSTTRENACFKLYNKNLSFDESQKFCISQGGKLAEEVTKDASSVYSAHADLDLLTNQNNFWIGATNRNCKGYSWNNHKEIELNDLWAEDSRVYGVAIDKSSSGGRWHTISVTKSLPFVCTFHANNENGAMRSPIRNRAEDRRGNIDESMKAEEMEKAEENNTNEQAEIEESKKASMSDVNSERKMETDENDESKKVMDETDERNKKAVELEGSEKASMAEESNSKKSDEEEMEDSRKAAMMDEMNKKQKEESEDTEKKMMGMENGEIKNAISEETQQSQIADKDENKMRKTGDSEDSMKAAQEDEMSKKSETESDDVERKKNLEENVADSKNEVMDESDASRKSLLAQTDEKQNTDAEYKKQDLAEAQKCLDNLFDPKLYPNRKAECAAKNLKAQSAAKQLKNLENGEIGKEEKMKDDLIRKDRLEDIDYSDQASLLDELAKQKKLRATCPAQWTQYNANSTSIGICFRRFEASLTFEDARMFCLKQGGHLASIHNQRQLLLLSALLHNAPNNTIYDQTWIGLNRVHQKYYVYEDESPMDFTRWLPGAPNIHDCTVFTGNELPNYSHKGTQYKFGDFPCEKRQKSVLCEVTIGNGVEKSPPTCENGWIYYSHDGSAGNGKCYKQIIGKANFAKARQICRANNAYVASVRNEHESRLVSALLKTTQNYSIAEQTWIGYVRDETRGFQWEDKSDPRLFSFNPWAEKLAKDLNCVVFTGNEITGDCRSEFKFVSVDCEQPQRATLCHKPATNGVGFKKSDKMSRI